MPEDTIENTTVETRKIESILRQLEKLDRLSQDTDLRLQEVTERLFGRVHKAEPKIQKDASPNEAINICETILWRIRNTTAAFISISLDIDAMIGELPEKPKTELSYGSNDIQ